MLVFNPMMGGIPLEGPFYQAMLWPPALISLALITTLAMPDRRWTRLQTGAGVLAVAVVIATGHVTPGLGLAVGWVIAAAAVAVFLLASYKGTIGAIAGLALLLSCAQLLQNSRDDLGLYYLSPYNWAFSANPVSDQLHTAVDTQEWLLASTTRADTILSWVDGDWVNGDRELYVVAGMMLWGENRVTLEPTLSDGDIARLDTIRPSMIAMYGQTMDAVLRFWSSIPAENLPTVPTCYDFAVDPQPGQRLHRHPRACLPDPADVGRTIVTTTRHAAGSSSRRRSPRSSRSRSPSSCSGRSSASSTSGGPAATCSAPTSTPSTGAASPTSSTTQFGFPLGMNLNYFPGIDITENTFAMIVNAITGIDLPRHQPARGRVLPARGRPRLPAASA